MNNLIGKFVKNPKITPVKDLIYYEGSLLSLGVDKDNKKHMTLWCDNNLTVNRWIIFKVSDNDYAQYIEKRITLKELILKEKSVIFYEIFSDNNGAFEERNFIEVEVKNIPNDYVPHKDSYYVKL